MAYNTGNAIGSTDPRDLSDNSENFDRAVNNAASATWTDRLGKIRTSLAGQIGYIGTGTDGAIEGYAAGQELSTYNTIIRYNSEFYRPSASATLPYTTTATTPDADPNLVSIGDANLRQDLANNTTSLGSDLVAKADTGETVTTALNQRVIYVGSVAEGLSGLAVLDGATLCAQSFFSGEGIGGGDFVGAASAAKSLHNGITHISPTVPPVSDQDGASLAEKAANFRTGVGETDPDGAGVFIRDTEGRNFLLEWSGIVTDGTVENNSAVDDLIAATPDGGTVSSRASGTLLMDIPDNPDTIHYGAFRLSRGISLNNMRHLTIRIKDFCTAHQLRVGNDPVAAVITKSSDSRVRRVNIDANSDGNYFTEPDSFRWWFKPGEFAPIKGVVVYCNEGDPNTKNVNVYDNVIEDTLHAVSFDGNLADNFDAAFLDGTKTDSLVEDCHAWGNVIRRTRGNALMMIDGVTNCSMYENKIYDAQYNALRFYVAVKDSKYFDNKVYVDYDRIFARWNDTDNGYFRNNDPASGQYKIFRLPGVRIGSGSAYDAATFTDSVVGCHAEDNDITFARLTFDAAKADFSAAACLSIISTHDDASITGGNVKNVPGRVTLISGDSTKTASGASISRVTAINSDDLAIQLNNKGGKVYGCLFIDCGQSTPALIRFNGAGGGVYDNRFDNAGPEVSKNLAEFYGDSIGLFFDGNSSRGYAGNLWNTAPATDVTGTGSNMPKQELTLQNGWDEPGSNQSPPGYTLDGDSVVVLSGSVVGGSSTSEVVCTLPRRARPEHPIFFAVYNSVDTVAKGSIRTNGDVRIEESVPYSGATSFNISFRAVRQ